MHKMMMIALGSMIAAHSVGANAASGTYNYKGNPLYCASPSFEFCTYPNRPGLTATVTFSPDFIQGNGDQTVGASAVSAWSVFDGVQTLSSSAGDTLRFGSTFTFNTSTLRTWSWGAVSHLTGQTIITSSAPLYQDMGDGFYSHGNGAWTNAGGAAAVPEPATWALMITGFGAVGMSMRRRQRGTTRVRHAV